MNRRILTGFITSAIQTVVYYLVFSVGWAIGAKVHEPVPMTIAEAVGLGIFFRFSMVTFGILMLAMNFIDALANSRRWTWGLLISVSILYLIYWGQSITYIPLKTALFLATGIIAIYSKIPIEKLMDKLFGTRWKTQQ